MDVEVGLFFAVLAATTFALAAPLARGLIDTGWSPGAVVFSRIGLAALVMIPFAMHLLRGRWDLLLRNARLILIMGAVSIAGTQFAYFSAIAAMDIGPATLIEFTAPVAVVGWLWLRRGERPSRLTVGGGILAIVGLVVVLDLFSGADLAWDGALWAFVAMFGIATYFVTTANTQTGLPPFVLACSGLLVGSLILGMLGALGLMPMTMTSTVPSYGGGTLPLWLVLVAMGVLSTAVPFTSSVAAVRRLGSRLASFVALLEVALAIIFAWLLVDQVPGLSQIVGGLLIVTGVIVVRLGEPSSRRETLS